jgi:hypothetical protein
MKLVKNVKYSIVLTLAGTIFTAYLIAVKIISRNCAFNEPCPEILGITACYLSFATFIVMFIIASIGSFTNKYHKQLSLANMIISGLGIIFSSHFTIMEIEQFFKHESIAYTLLIPTCIYGLIFYVTIFIISINWWRSTDRKC